MVLSQVSQPKYITALAKVCSSATMGRTRYDEISERTELRCGLWVSRDDIKAYRTENSPFILTNEMQGHPIEVKPGGYSSIKWTPTAGTPITVRFNGLTCALPENQLQSRAVSFTEYGIDILDASGNPLRRYNTEATIPRSSLRPKSDKRIQQLWEAVRSELGHEIEHSTPFRSSLTLMRQGVGPLPSNAVEEDPKQNRPPNIEDANYLIYHFLNERFSQSGIFRTISRERVPDSTEDLQEFVKFCKRDEYINLPYTSYWLEKLDREAPFIAILARNIRAFRTCEKRAVSTYVEAQKRKWNETKYFIGPREDLRCV